MRVGQARSGFTLIELVVVMAIIGIIGLAVVPAFLREATANNSDVVQPIASVLTGVQRMVADSGRAAQLWVEPVSGRYEARLVGADTASVRGTIAYLSGTTVRSDSAIAQFRFDPRGRAWGDSLHVSGNGRSVVVSLDPWTSNVRIHY